MFQRIKKLRKEQKIPQKAIYDEIGMDASQYSRFERGNGSVSVFQLAVIARILNCTTDFLIFGYDLKSNLEEGKDDLRNCIKERNRLLHDRDEWLRTKHLMEEHITLLQEQLTELKKKVSKKDMDAPFAGTRKK